VDVADPAKIITMPYGESLLDTLAPFNQLASAWIQFMIHDWFQHVSLERSKKGGALLITELHIGGMLARSMGPVKNKRVIPVLMMAVSISTKMTSRTMTRMVCMALALAKISGLVCMYFVLYLQESIAILSTQ